MMYFGLVGDFDKGTKAMLADILSTTALITLLTGQNDCSSIHSIRAEATLLLKEPLPTFEVSEWWKSLNNMITKLVVVGRLMFEQAKNFVRPTQFEAAAERLTNALEMQFLHVALHI